MFFGWVSAQGTLSPVDFSFHSFNVGLILSKGDVNKMNEVVGEYKLHSLSLLLFFPIFCNEIWTTMLEDCLLFIY